jgi:NRPS condensation-like uncharacterized protein
VRTIFHIDGELDFDVLAQATADVNERHDALQMCFGYEGRTPILLAMSARQAEVHIFDKGHLVSHEEAIAKVSNGTTKPFDPSGHSRLRVVLARVSPTCGYLGISVDHLVCDGESMQIILSDLGVAYEARLGGSAPTWAGRAQSFRAWAMAESSIYSGSELARRLEYWRNVLDPLEAYPEVRLSGMREPRQSNGPTASQEVRVLPSGMLSSLQARAAESGVTLYASMCAMLMLSIHLATARSVVGITSPVSVRRSGWDSMVGWLAQVAPIRVRIDTRESVEALAQHVMRRVAEVAEHALPIPLLLEHLQPERLQERRWRPRVYLDVDVDSYLPMLKLVGIKAQRHRLDNGITRPSNGIVMWIESTPRGAEMILVFQKGVWSRNHARDFLRCYHRIVKSGVRYWSAPIEDWAAAVNGA